MKWLGAIFNKKDNLFVIKDFLITLNVNSIVSNKRYNSIGNAYYGLSINKKKDVDKVRKLIL
ncbi:hypothetical protein GF345_04565 [Candidatus Woesearchaeota archaeon]|nr:hypothetical protein [Candidatus Woesearchaeota archaeon]